MSWINTVTQWWQQLNELTAYAIEVVVVLVIALVVSIVLKYILRIVIRRAKATQFPWDEVVIFALKRPCQALVWVLALVYLVRSLFILLTSQDAIELMWVSRTFLIAILLLVVWFLVRLVDGVELHFTRKMQADKKAPVDGASVRAVIRLLKIVIWVGAVLVALGVLKIPISGLLTFGGVGGVALALGSKDLLANFTGGLLVYLNKQFAVGDWIYSPDRNIEGFVEYIGWRLTRIRGFDKRPIYVPNSIFSNIIVVNATRMTNRQIKQTVGVRYDDAEKVLLILQKVREMLKNHPDIDQNCTTLVNLVDNSAFDTSEINFLVYTFTKTKAWVEFRNVQDDVMIKVQQIITECGAECAFPTRTLHVPEGLTVDMTTAPDIK